MNSKIILLCVVIIIIISCEKTDPCDVLVNGVYEFPKLPENHSMTNEEIDDFWDLPADICECITTEGLIETCLNYPNLSLIHAGSSPQSGYTNLIRARFRGARELEIRTDRGTYLIKKYQTIDPLGYNPNWEPVDIGAYLFKVTDFEIIFSQYANLETLTKNEKISLIEKAIDIYDKMKYDLENYSLFGLECTTTLLGRLMYQNSYEEMVELYNNDDIVWELLEFYGPANIETVELVYNLSKEYLNQLKNN